MKNEKIVELKQIAEKIAELEAKFQAQRLMGNLNGAFETQKALRFAKNYFKEQSRGVGK